MRRFLLVLGFGALAFAQAPSQAPSSAPYPNIPQEGKMPAPPGSRKPKIRKDESDLMKAGGWVRELATDHVLVETPDHRGITFHLTKDTKYLDGDNAVALKDVTLGRYLDVEAQEDNEEEYWAVRVHLSAPPATVVKAAQADDPEEDDRPRLKFGKPAEKPAEKKEARDDGDDAAPQARPSKPEARPVEIARAEPPDGEGDVPSAPSIPKPDPHAAFLDDARELAFNFTEGLPNYMCQEMVTRYFSDNHAGTLWKPQDVVSEDVVWKGDSEEYRNVQIDGKKVNPEKVGDRAWSTGEFGTILADLMQPSTNAQFHYARAATLNHHEALMFDFTVDQPNSHWTIHEGGQQVRPAYSGTIWFDRETKRALRIEYSAEDIPKTFPADAAELALEYDYVQLGIKKFLLPVHSDVLMCHRGSSICAKNAIDFRNYHKYGAESEIQFGNQDQNAPALAPKR